MSIIARASTFFTLAVLCIATIAFADNAAPIYQPTGDDLFDRYAELLISQIWSADRQATEKLDISAVADWAGEFGDNPDYWQLHFAVFDDRDALRQSIENGVFNSASFLLLDPNQLENLEPDAALGLIDQAISLDPANSYFYYQKGIQLLKQDRAAEALTAFKAGNQTVRNQYPLCFTHKKYLEHQATSAALANKVVLSHTLSTTPIPSMSPFKEQIRHVVEISKSTGRTELMDELLTFTRRFAQMEDQLWLHVLVAKGGADVLLDGYMDIAPDEPGRSEVIAAMRTQLEHIKDSINQLTKACEQFYQQYPEIAALRDQGESSVLTWSEVMIAYAEDWPHQFELEIVPGLQECFNGIDPDRLYASSK